jgi:uncharacterized membrane protein YagU involved in acid resistance
MVRGFFAGLVATAIVSALVYANGALGFLPEFDLLDEIGDFNARIGLPATTQAAWATHAILGIVVYGAIYTLVMPILPGGSTASGVAFGLLAWLAMMVTFMPLAGHDLFAQNLPWTVVGATLAFNLVYGVVLGLCFGALGDAEAEAD